MTTTLRQEIKDILVFREYNNNQEYYMTHDELINMILAKFEKRIDSEIEQKYARKKYSRTPQHEYSMVAEEVLTEFKKEMLK